MAEDFTLYGSPHSQFTYKVALMLALCGQAFAFRYVSFQKGMHRTPEFLAMSRWGQVPVLRDRERVLCQSGAILEHLAESLGRFGGGDRDSREAAREWLYWNADRLAPPIYGCYGVRLGELKLLPIAYDPAIVRKYREDAETALAVLDSRLKDSDFLVGAGPTIADICCYGEIPFAVLSGLDAARWPALAAWASRLAALPRFKGPFDLLPMADAQIAP